MITMLMVAGGLGLIIGGMLFYDSLERKRKERYEATVAGVEYDLMTGPERNLAGKRDMEIIRGYLEEFERRITLKLCLINAVAVAVAAALVKCMK